MFCQQLVVDLRQIKMMVLLKRGDSIQICEIKVGLRMSLINSPLFFIKDQKEQIIYDATFVLFKGSRKRIFQMASISGTWVSVRLEIRRPGINFFSMVCSHPNHGRHVEPYL